MTTKLTATQKLERKKDKLRKKIEKLSEQEALARQRWTKGYRRFMKASLDLANLKITQSKRADRLRRVITAWPSENQRLTRQRDNFREQLEALRQELRDCEIGLNQLAYALVQQSQATDEIVDRVFALNEDVVTAARQRDNFLMSKVFPHLRRPDGTLRRQITFISSNQLRKVVAMVNSITHIDSALAELAEQEINNFFARYELPLVDDMVFVKVKELLKNVLTSKRTFTIGPSLYEFLTLDLDVTVFPELVRAQQYLKASFRSEKTNSYIRIYSRLKVTDKWQPVLQS